MNIDGDFSEQLLINIITRGIRVHQSLIISSRDHFVPDSQFETRLLSKNRLSMYCQIFQDLSSEKSVSHQPNGLFPRVVNLTQHTLPKNQPYESSHKML